MIRDIPITTARHEITSLPERLEKDPGAVAITRRGKPVLAVMPWELYEALMETRGHWICNLRNYHHAGGEGVVTRHS
jgi:prevent-host-death family protein